MAKKKEEEIKKEVKQVYVHSSEKIERMKKEGWKVVATPNDAMGKIIKKGGNDLTLMEKEI